MIRRPPRSTRTDTLFPYTTLFRSHRQIDGDPVALLRPGRLQHIGEAADLRVKLAIADPPRFRLGVIRLPDDGNVVAPAFQMPVKAVGADVQHPVLEPFYAEVRLVEGPVRYLGEWLDPEIGRAHV